MANTKKLLKKTAAKRQKNRVEVTQQDLLTEVQANLAQCLKPQATLLIALSGGLDSVVLLHILAKITHSIPFNLYAMHVHHGLSKNADSWASFCAQLCSQLQVPLQIQHINVKATKSGLEAAARALRYRALFDFKLNGQPPGYIVTAHHQGDQAETLLLQLFRGAGIKGLASMAMVYSARRLLRPLLNTSREALQNYALAHHLTWCEDESNLNTDFDRNFVRNEVLPLLGSRYSAIQTTLARTAAHIAEAHDLLDDLATLDAKGLLADNSLCLLGLAELNLARIKNVLRWWFANNQLMMPTTVHLDEIVRQLLHAKQDAKINIQLQHLTLKCYQQRAYLLRPPIKQAVELVWNGEAELNLPDGNVLYFEKKLGVGLAVKLLDDHLVVSNIRHPKIFKINALRPSKTLKHLFQEAGIPPWQRTQIPLIFSDNKLVYIPNIGGLHSMQAKDDEFGLVISWVNKHTTTLSDLGI